MTKYVGANDQTKGLGNNARRPWSKMQYIIRICLSFDGMYVCAVTWQPACSLSIRMLVMQRDTV